MAVLDFSVNKVLVWAELLGTEIELTRVETHYALNSIPTAVLHCAIGRDIRTLAAAEIHLLLDSMKVNVPITVFANGAEVNNSGIVGSTWPIGDFVIFSGRVVGVGFQKSRSGSASLVLYCRHFLMDLEYATTNTGSTHPVNAGAFNMQAGLRVDAGKPNFSISTLASKRFTRANIQSDMWAASISPFYNDVIQQPVVFQGQNIGQGQGANDAANALKKFEPAIDNGTYRYGVPLQIDPAFAVLGFEPAIDAIIYDVSNDMRGFHHSTFWEKLVSEMASKFLFAIVPMASRALVIPFIPGLQPVWATIDPDEYESIALSGELSRALFGVVISTGYNSITGAVGFHEGQAAAINKVGGIYENPNMNEGMYLFRSGPQWLSNVVSQPAWARKAAAPFGVKNNAFFQGVGAGPDFPEPANMRAQAGNLWDAYAQGVYLYEVLRSRRGVITGSIRFDIAPGSSIAVNTAEEKFIGAQTGVDGQTLFGMVTKVSTVIDAEAVYGATTIELGFYRDEIENIFAGFSTSRHPLYTSVFVGAPLVDGIAVEPPPVLKD